MTKKFLTILSIGISCILLLYTVLSHYGLIRLVYLRNRSLEYYSAKYPALPKAVPNRVVISFAIKDGYDTAKFTPFINSLLDQSVRVDDIGVNLTYKNISKIPERYKKILNIYGLSKEYDEVTNFIPTILRETEANTMVIVVDPNMSYGTDFVADLVDASQEHPDALIYGKAQDVKYGLLAKPKFFSETLCENKNTKSINELIETCTNVKAITIGCPNTYKL